MSKIDELIAEMCPNGVEYSTVEHTCSIKIGDRLEKKSMNTDALYPVYGGGVVPTGRYDEMNTPANSITIGRRGTIGYVNFITEDFWGTSNLFIIKPETDRLIMKFVYYAVKVQEPNLRKPKKIGGTPAIDKPDIKKIVVPIPPLEVQKEIVAILDKFDKLVTSISEGLPAEIEARRKQYEYYRNSLLGFDDVELPRIKLGEVAMYSKSRIASVDLDHENYVGVDNILQNRQGKVDSIYVPSNGNMTRYERGDVLIGNIRPYLKKIWHADRVGGTNGDVLVIQIKENYKIKIQPRFIYHVLSSDRFFAFNMQNAKGAKMPRGNKESIMKFEFPLLSIQEQDRVILNLDKFDKLVTSISEGLPAEIEARRKQYEYYRTKLLTFQELPV